MHKLFPQKKAIVPLNREPPDVYCLFLAAVLQVTAFPEQFFGIQVRTGQSPNTTPELEALMGRVVETPYPLMQKLPIWPRNSSLVVSNRCSCGCAQTSTQADFSKSDAAKGAQGQ